MPIVLFDPRDLGRAAGQADDRRAEQVGVAADLTGAVALGIDCDEDDVDGGVVRAQLPPQLHQARQRRRADVGTMGEAEEDRIGAAASLLLAKGWPLLSTKVKGPPKLIWVVSACGSEVRWRR